MVCKKHIKRIKSFQILVIGYKEQVITKLASGGYLVLTDKEIYGCLILKEKFSSTIMIKSVCVKKTSNVWKLIFYNGYN